MKKFLLVGVLGLLIVAIGCYIGVAYFLGGIVKTGVNRLGPQVTQSKVELASAKLSPLSGSGTLSGLTVGNPPGWSEGRAFYLGTIHLQVEPKTVFSDVIVIDELTIDQPEFNYETKIVTSNIQDLLKNVEQYAGGGEKAADKAGPPKKFIVKKLRLTNGKASVSAAGVAAIPVPLPEIALDDLGVKEGGITGTQLSVAVMKDVLGKVVTAATGAIKSGAISVDKLKDTAKGVEGALKGLLGKERK